MPPAIKSRLPVRVSPLNKDAQKSPDSDSEKEKWLNQRPSRIPRATSSQEIPVKGDQQKGKGNFLKKTVKKVIRSVTPTQQGSPSGPSTVKVSRRETSSKDLMKSPSPQNETVKAGKNLVPRETKASFLRKQAQLDKKQVSVDKKKVKSAGKTSSSMADQRVQKHNDDLQKRKGEPQNATVEPLPSNDRKEVQNTVRLLTTETKHDESSLPNLGLECFSQRKEEAGESCKASFSICQEVPSKHDEEHICLQPLSSKLTSDAEEVLNEMQRKKKCAPEEDKALVAVLQEGDRNVSHLSSVTPAAENVKGDLSAEPVKSLQILPPVDKKTVCQKALTSDCSAPKEELSESTGVITIEKEHEKEGQSRDDRGIPQSVNQDTAVESVSDMVEQNQMEDDMGSYSDDSFEDGSSSDEDQTDHLSSNCEKSHDATASPNDNRDTVKENKEKMSGDDELDSLDKELFGSLRQEKESVKSKPTTILLGTEETNLACSKSEPNGASGNVDQSKVRKEEGNVSSVSKSTSPHAKKKVRFAVKPEVFLVPFSSMEPVCYVSVVGDETTSTSDDCSPVLSNVFLDPYSMSFADDLDDRVNEMEEKTGKEELVLKGARQVKAVREANIAWSLGARGGRSTGASKEKKRLEVLLEMEELDEGQTSDGEEEQSSKAGKTCVTETSESSKKANEVMGHGSQKANEVTAHGPQKANKVTARGPQKGKRPKTEEAKALATMVEELNELHSKIGVIRKAFSGKMVPEVEKSAVKKKESFSRMTLLQQVKSIVTSIAQMSEDFNDGMQGALEESALHNENLERDLSEMKQEYLQALDDQDAKIKSLTEQNEELRDQLQDALDADPEYATLREDMEDLKLQIKEMNQENESLTHMISTTNALNDNLWEQVDTLEEKLENCRSESQLTSLQVMGDEHPDVKSLKGKIQELEVQVDEGEMQRRHIEKEMEAMIVENEELFGRVSQLEKELKSSQSEGNGLRSKLEEMSRELCREKPRQDHKEGDSNPFSVSEGDSVEAKVLKERIRQLEFELEEEDLQRRAIGGLVESLNDENKNLRTQVCDLEETMKNSQSDTSDLQQNSLAMKHELSRRRSELEVKERELSNLRDSVTRKEIQCQKLLKLVSCYEEERRHTNEDIESAKKEFDECNANKQKLTIQVSELKNELLVMKKETLHSRQVFDFVHLREEAELLKGSIALGDRIKEERDQLQTSYQEKKRNVDELESHIAILKNDLGAERISLKERAVELQQTKRCIEEKDKELQTVKTRLRKVEIELSQSKTELNEKGGKSGQENNHLQQRVVELESKLSEKHITLEKSSDELKESKKEMETVRALLDEKSANVEALKSAFEEKEALVARSKKEMESMRAFLDEKSAKVVALESVLEVKEVYITRHRKDFEKLSASLRDKDSQLQNAQQSAQVKDEEVNSIKSKLSEAERALQASVTLSKDQECSLKQERMKWKEDTKRLEAIVRRQQKDLKDWKGYLRSRDGELKALRLSLEDNKRKLESVNCLLDEKERKVGGFWKKLIKKQQVASKASSNAQSKLQRGKCFPAEMANVKRENVKLSAANAEIETRVKEMEANAKDENEDAMEKLNNALEHVKLQRNQIKELKVQLRKSRSDAHCSQDIVEKKKKPAFKQPLYSNEGPAISSTC